MAMRDVLSSTKAIIIYESPPICPARLGTVCDLSGVPAFNAFCLSVASDWAATQLKLLFLK
jgi:hypothetical protein